jgi:hypothetical protein
VDGRRRREIGISGGGSLRRPRPTQGCSVEKKKMEVVVAYYVAFSRYFLTRVE